LNLGSDMIRVGQVNAYDRIKTSGDIHHERKHTSTYIYNTYIHVMFI